MRALLAISVAARSARERAHSGRRRRRRAGTASLPRGDQGHGRAPRSASAPAARCPRPPWGSLSLPRSPAATGTAGASWRTRSPGPQLHRRVRRRAHLLLLPGQRVSRAGPRGPALRRRRPPHDACQLVGKSALAGRHDRQHLNTFPIPDPRAGPEQLLGLGQVSSSAMQCWVPAVTAGDELQGRGPVRPGQLNTTMPFTAQLLHRTPEHLRRTWSPTSTGTATAT